MHSTIDERQGNIWSPRVWGLVLYIYIYTHTHNAKECLFPVNTNTSNIKEHSTITSLTGRGHQRNVLTPRWRWHSWAIRILISKPWRERHINAHLRHLTSTATCYPGENTRTTSYCDLTKAQHGTQALEASFRQSEVPKMKTVVFL